MTVRRDGDHFAGNLHQVPTGAVRHGKLQSCAHTWCGKRAFTGPAGGEASEQGGEAAFPGHHGQRNVLRTGDSLRHLVRHQPIGEGDAQTSKAHMAASKHLLRYLAGTVDFSITYRKKGFKLTALSDATGATTPITASQRFHTLSSFQMLR